MISPTRLAIYAFLAFLAINLCIGAANAQDPTATPVPATTDTNSLYTFVLIIILILNLAVGAASRGWVIPATIGMISISIACAALFTPIYREILFSPWIQLMLILVAIMSLYGVTTRDNL